MNLIDRARSRSHLVALGLRDFPPLRSPYAQERRSTGDRGTHDSLALANTRGILKTSRIGRLW